MLMYRAEQENKLPTLRPTMQTTSVNGDCHCHIEDIAEHRASPMVFCPSGSKSCAVGIEPTAWEAVLNDAGHY